MQINKTYLQWVGARDYKTIEDFMTEVKEQGLSKRVPNHHIAGALMEPGTVVFVAHDEGEHEDCPDCLEVKACETCDGKGKIVATEQDGEAQDCADCSGLGEIVRGTGGKVTLEDGSELAYRDWLGMRRHAKHNARDGKPTGENGVKAMCERCGGSGRLPLGKIFGLYVPSAAEYIVSDDMEAEARDKIAAKGVDLIPEGAVALEQERKCGRRKVGGSYVVTRPAQAPSAKAEATVDELVAQGLIEPEAVQVTGDFVEFVNPVAIKTKRFRGIRRYMLEAAVEAEAELIAEAI